MPRPPSLDPLFRSLHSIKGVGPQLSALLTRLEVKAGQADLDLPARTLRIDGMLGPILLRALGVVFARKIAPAVPYFEA